MRFIFERGYHSLIDFINDDIIAKNKIEIINLTTLLKDISEIAEEIDFIKSEISRIESIINKGHDDSMDDDNNGDKDANIDTLRNARKDYIKLFTELIPNTSIKLKAILKKYTCIEGSNKESNLYTYLYQLIGNNLRSSGLPFDSEFLPDKFFTLADRAKRLLKNIRKVNNDENKQTLICIDAIRNPFEATFFKDRYSAFYLLSVNTEDNFRRSRLSNKLTQKQIDSLDKTEYPKKLNNDEKFYNQNISACLEISDIHIYNPDTNDHKYFDLTKQLLKYIILMKHPGLITPTHEERCMRIAYNAKLNSGCLSRQVGAVVTGDDYAIKSVGWNEVPKGQVSCSLRDIKQYCKNKDVESYSNYEISNKDFSDTIHLIYKNINYKELKGRKYPYCFKDIYNSLMDKDNQVHTRALHAEENAFLQISKYGGVGVKGGYLFTTASPCELCAKKAYQLGIKKIYYIDPYPGISQSHILKFGKLENSDNPKMNLFFGAIGNAYISLYTPRMSFKDELKMLEDPNIEKIINNIEKEN